MKHSLLPLILVALSTLPLRPAVARKPVSAPPVPVPAPGVWFVATDGNDNWSGTLPASNAMGTDGPLATLDAARAHVRQARAKATGPLTVWVRGGNYYLKGTLNLNADDSGTLTSPVIYRAYPGEHPDLLGGLPIAASSFHPYQGQIVKADVAAQGLADTYFRQLFFNGKRQILARYPNADPNNPVAGGWAFVDGPAIPMYKEVPGESRNTLVYRAADARLWAHPEDAEVVIFPRYNWWNDIIPVKSVDPTTRTITLAQNADFAIRPGDRYYVRNVLEELDSPGEWYLDKRDHSLYFWPPAPLAGATVVAPTLENLMVLDGVSNVTFHGFHFESAEGTGIILNHCENCVIEASTIDNVGSRAEDDLAAISISGGHNTGAKGDDIYDVGSKGIIIDGGDRATLQPAGNYADDNYIHHTGVFYKQGSGICLNGVGNRATHNLIHDMPRYAIEFAGNDLVIEYNRIRQTNLETSDTGAIYSWSVDWTKRGTQIRYNFITDTVGFSQEDGTYRAPDYSWGVYLDDGTCGTTVYGNIIARDAMGGGMIHGGRDNVFENNIFVDGRDQQMYYDGYLQGDSMVKQMTGLLKGFQTNPVYAKYPELAKLDPTTGYQLAGNKFLRNIVCYSGANSNLYLATDLWNDQTESDDNVIFHPGGDLGIDRNDGHGIAPALQWAAWKKLGFEAHSVVADPKFVDAAHDDYRLRKDSPALKLGFVPIPVDEIGPYVDPARASWPIVEAPGAREHPTPPETPIPGYGDAVARAAASKAPVPIGRWAGPAPTAAGPWPAGDFATFPLAQTPEGNAATGQPAVARVAYDDANLYVEINVPPGGPLKLGASWGKDEGGEVCFQALGTASSPINVIHGFANGAHECVTDAGASTGQAAKLDNAVLFQTQIQGNGWVAHWTIPWEATGVVPHPGAKFRFNLGLLHSGSGEWDNWIGTGDSTWRLQNAGSIVLK